MAVHEIHGDLLSDAPEIALTCECSSLVDCAGYIWLEAAGSSLFSSSGGGDDDNLFKFLRHIFVCCAVAAGRSWTRVPACADRMRLLGTPLCFCVGSFLAMVVFNPCVWCLVGIRMHSVPHSSPELCGSGYGRRTSEVPCGVALCR